MRISFHHANPHAGNESVLLRFEQDDTDHNSCLLIDAGTRVQIDDLLEPTDKLAGICLTHAHRDHYATLPTTHRDDVPIYTSAATADILQDVFDVASSDSDFSTTDAVADAVTPIEDWTSVASDIEVHPVPAGHVPGAVGFLVRAFDGDETHYLLATGDFTCRSAGGFPGFEPDGFVDIDVLFLPAATNETFGESLTEALGTTLEHAHGGAPTLVTTSGLVGVQFAYLLSALVVKYELSVPIRVVGQVAKLYDQLDYDCSGVEEISLFHDPQACLDPGVITIAGPDIPRERSSGRLFGILRDNPNACVVQLVGSGKTPMTEGRCTIHDYELVNHPSHGTLEAVHDSIDPQETVVVHSHDGAGEEFNHLDSVVWGTGDTSEHTLYDGHRWQVPSWVHGGTVTSGGDQNLQRFASAALLDSFSVPSLDRHEEPNLEAEGVDDSKIATLLHHGADAATSLDAPNQFDERNKPETTTEPMTANENLTEETDEKATKQPTGLIDTTGPDLQGQTCTDLSENIDSSSLTPNNMISARATKRLMEKESRTTSSGESRSDNSEEEQGQDTNTEADGAPDSEVETSDETEREATVTEGDESAQEDTREPESDGENSPTEDTSDVDTTEPAESQNTEPDEVGIDDNLTDEEHFTVTLDPLTLLLAESAITMDTHDTESARTVSEVVAETVQQYALSLLAGEASGNEPESLSVDLVGTSIVEQAIGDLINRSEELDSIADLIVRGVSTVSDSDMNCSVEVEESTKVREYVEAIVQNEAYEHSTQEEVVQTALFWRTRE